MKDDKSFNDFNDLSRLAGPDEVRRQLLGPALDPAADPDAPATDPPPAAPGADALTIDAPDGDEDASEISQGGRRSALDVVLALTANLELFHDAAGTGYFAAEYDGRREVWPIQSRAGADLVQRRYLANTGRGLPAQPLRDVLATLSLIHI